VLSSLPISKLYCWMRWGIKGWRWTKMERGDDGGWKQRDDDGEESDTQWLIRICQWAMTQYVFKKKKKRILRWPQSDQVLTMLWSVSIRLIKCWLCSGQFPSSLDHSLVSFPQTGQALTMLWSVSISMIKYWSCSGQSPVDRSSVDHAMVSFPQTDRLMSCWPLLIIKWSMPYQSGVLDQLLI